MQFEQKFCEEVFIKKYMINGEKNAEEVFKGVADEVASIEEDKEKWSKIFYEQISSGKLLPGGRILANARPDSKMKYYSNCYTIDIEDSMNSIYEALKEDAIISQSGGGVGFNISKLRPEGDVISRGGTSSGPISFMKVFDQSAKVIHTGGGRRSAHIAILNCDHPDIEKFITAKQGDKNKELTQFNISVGITNKFMQAVEKDEDWNLVFKDKVYKTLKARELYEKICKNAYEHNEPGILLLDTINKYNNGYWAFEIKQCNPCITGDTKIAVADGRVAVPIKQLAEEGKDVPVYCLGFKNEQVIRYMRNPRITGEQKDIYQVILEDDSVINCTSNHKFFLSDGTLKETLQLKTGDKLYINKSSYESLSIPSTLKDGLITGHDFFQGSIAIKKCEYCNTEIITNYTKREICFCNEECHTQYTEKMEALFTTNKAEHVLIVKDIKYSHVDTVYNGTVDDFHNYAIVLPKHLNTKDNDEAIEFVYSPNCGEVVMPAYSLCALSSLNLVKFVKEPYTNKAEFNFNEFEETISYAVRFLDNMLEVTKYPLQKIEDLSKQWRRIGLGFTALGDALAMLGIPYGSKESKELCHKIGNILRNQSYIASVNLAKEKGPFPAINVEKLMNANFIKQLPESIQTLISKQGLRNIGINTCAPVGTGSVAVGNNCSSGIEPIFALEYYRNIRTDNKEGTKQELIQDYAWKKFNDIKGSLTAEEVEKCKKAFVTTENIDVMDAIDIQAIFQQYIDHSISKTANLPNNYSYEKYKELFNYAYSAGLKGFTTFNPNGSVKGILQTSATTEEVKVKEGRPVTIVETHAPKRPDVVNCHIHQCTIKGCKWIFLVGMLEDKPYEILGGKEEYINIPKKYVKGIDTKSVWIVKKKINDSKTHYNLVVGSLDKANDEYQLFENVANIFPVEMGTPTRLISGLLRHGMRIQDIIDQLGKVPQEDSMFTFEAGVRRVLKHYIKDGVNTKNKCPECKSEMVFNNGCASCPSCGYSKCG
jgi:ribonucleotide reductase alpha subunit